MGKLSTYENCEPQLNDLESSKPEITMLQSETEEETRPDYYEHYQPDWKLTIYTTDDQYEEI